LPCVMVTLVIAAGVIGGFVGLQRRLKELTIQDLTLMSNSWIYTCLSPLVGGVLALLLYILFISKLVSGDLFPVFKPDAAQVGQAVTGFQTIMLQQADGYQSYGKLIFWSFIAGYSEHFVTDVMNRFEGAAIRSLPPSAESKGGNTAREDNRKADSTTSSAT